jgi:hypothetical protein
MINRIKWVILLIILFILLKVVDVENWFNSLTLRKVLLNLVIWFRLFLVVDFVFSCFIIITNYRPALLSFNCFYVGFVVIVFLLMTLYIKHLKEGGNEDGTKI